MNIPTSIKKYRPSLSHHHISYLIKLLKENYHYTESEQILKILVPLEAKIASESIAPAYTTQKETKESNSDLIASLSTSEAYSNPDIPYNQATNKVAYNASAYTFYMAHTPSKCTMQELSAAREHMYVNDLMTKEEEHEYEKTSESWRGE